MKKKLQKFIRLLGLCGVISLLVAFVFFLQDNNAGAVPLFIGIFASFLYMAFGVLFWLHDPDARVF